VDKDKDKDKDEGRDRDRDVEVRRREQDYEITVGGRAAGHAEFEEHSGVVVFTHTTIDDAFEGQGLGSQLARAALDDVRNRGLRARPLCPFIARWIERHPDYADVVTS
jgi:predicted GNAT family acetyltransferase